MSLKSVFLVWFPLNEEPGQSKLFSEALMEGWKDKGNTSSVSLTGGTVGRVVAGARVEVSKELRIQRL